jgi:cytoskeletal protein CcmA (bactofilin family)
MADANDGDVTVLGRGARLEGDFVISGSIRIEGQFKGHIAAGGSVVLSPGSVVDADIEGEDVSVGGTLRGNVHAKNRAEVTSAGRLQGDIASRALIVAEGAYFEGRSSMGGS